MKRLPSPSQDCSLGVPEFPEKSCQNNWNPHPRPTPAGSWTTKTGLSGSGSETSESALAEPSFTARPACRAYASNMRSTFAQIHLSVSDRARLNLNCLVHPSECSKVCAQYPRHVVG